MLRRVGIWRELKTLATLLSTSRQAHVARFLRGKWTDQLPRALLKLECSAEDKVVEREQIESQPPTLARFAKYSKVLFDANARTIALLRPCGSDKKAFRRH